jgi:hypothetical protein
MLGMGRACGMIVAWRMRSDRVGSCDHPCVFETARHI